MRLRSLGVRSFRPTINSTRHYRILHKKINGGPLTNTKSKVNPWSVSTKRTIVGAFVRTLPRLLKFRYLALGGTVGGGVAAGKVCY